MRNLIERILTVLDRAKQREGMSPAECAELANAIRVECERTSTFFVQNEGKKP